MNKDTLRSLTVISSILLLAAFVFAAIESKGKVVETRVGMLGIVVTAGFLFLAAYLINTKPPAVPPTPPAPAPHPPVPEPPAPLDPASN